MKALQLNISIMKLLFLWPFDNLSDGINSMFRRLYVVGTIVLSASTATYALLRQTWHHFEDVGVINESLAPICAFYGQVFMYYFFNKNLSKIQKLISDVAKFQKFSGCRVIQETERNVHKFTKWTFIYFTIAVLVTVGIPIVSMGDCKERRVSDEYSKHDPCGMPVRVWYPFDVSGPILYPLALIGFSYSVITAPLRGLAMSICLIGLLMHVLDQIRQCKKVIAKVFETKDNAEMSRRVKFGIQYHILIIEYAERVNYVFGTMMIIHICLTSLVISLICYQIVISESLYDEIRYIMHIFGWIILLFTACFFGQKLINESCSLADIAYQTTWYEVPVDLQKCIQILITRCQKPLTLTAASLGIMSFPTFLRVIKGAYSYLTLLLTLLKEN